jgi:hypothetical protein
MTAEEVRKNCAQGVYDNNEQAFYKDACEAVGITNHPKAARVYQLAYAYGHSSGYSEVFCYFVEFAELVK